MSLFRLKKSRKSMRRPWVSDLNLFFLAINNYISKGNLKEGVPNHLFLGHGPTQDHFEKRDFGTTNDMFYEKKMTTQATISPNFFSSKNYKNDS